MTLEHIFLSLWVLSPIALIAVIIVQAILGASKISLDEFCICCDDDICRTEV